MDTHLWFSTTISIVIEYYNFFTSLSVISYNMFRVPHALANVHSLDVPELFFFSFFWDVFVFTNVFFHNSFHTFYIVFRHTFFCQFFDAFLSSSCCGPYFLYTGIVLCFLCILVSSYIASTGTYFFIFAIISF